MSRSFLDRRSTPISNSRRLEFQELIIPEFTYDDFKLDSWGRQFENEIDQKLFKTLESGHRKYEEFQKKRELNKISLQLIKDRITELEELKSSNSIFYDAPSESVKIDFSLKKEAILQVMDTVLKETDLDHNAKAEDTPYQTDQQPPQDKLVTVELVPLEPKTNSIPDQISKSEDASRNSIDSLEEFVQYIPPRPPINLDQLLLEREPLEKELKESKKVFNDLCIESDVLELDLGYYENNFVQLTQTSRNLFKDCVGLLNKLKIAGYANNYEVDALKKLTMFFKMTLSDTPPNPDLLGTALDKIFGDETNYFQMPDINTVLSKLQQNSTSSAKNNGGSRINLNGSSSNLKGSSSNLKGSTRNLRGSTAGLGDWNSDMHLAGQSFANLMDI